MTDLVKQQNERCGVASWQLRGWTGKGVVVLNCEPLTDKHGSPTTDRILDAAPDATVLNADWQVETKAGKVTSLKINYRGINYGLEEFVRAHNVRVLNKSAHGNYENDADFIAMLADIKARYNLVFVSISGNTGAVCNSAFPSAVSIWVGAVSDKDEYVKFFCNGEKKEFATYMGDFYGTSFSSPYVAGMCAQLIQRFPTITQEQIEQFFIDHVTDLETPGRDIYTGWGALMMPKKTKIIIPIGSSTMSVDGHNVPLEQPAIIDKKTGRTLVPVRAISEALGAEVAWDNSKKEVQIEL